MQAWKRLALFASGFVLYAVVMVLAGILAAVQVPRAYFQLFAPNMALALFLSDAALFALPVFLFCFAWCVGTLWRFRNSLRQAATWCFAGIALAWAGWSLLMIRSSIDASSTDSASIGTHAFALLVPPWFAALDALAPWLGFAAAVFMLSRLRRSTPWQAAGAR